MGKTSHRWGAGPQSQPLWSAHVSTWTHTHLVPQLMWDPRTFPTWGSLKSFPGPAMQLCAFYSCLQEDTGEQQVFKDLLMHKEPTHP